MNQKQRDSWRKTREKGQGRYIARGIVISMLCLIAGVIIWKLGRIFISGKRYEFLLENIDTAVVMAVGFGIAGFLQAKREWNTNEKEYLANQLGGNEGANKGVVSRALEQPNNS